MKESNIIIISNSKSFAQNIVSKVLLLRKSDDIKILNYKEASEQISNYNSSLILIHIEKDIEFDFVKQIKNLNNLKSTSIIMISDNIDSEFLCKAFDSGIDDFVSENIDETTLNMRIMWSLKKKQIKELEHRNAKLLSLIEVTRENGFYEKPYTQMLFEREYKKCITKYEDTIFMIIQSDVNCKSENTNKTIEKAIHKNIRKNDLCGLVQDNKFYLILYKTNEKGAKRFFERTNDILPFEKSISASAIRIDNIESFKEAESLLNKKLTEALNAVNTLKFVETKKQKIREERKENEFNAIIELQKNGAKKVKYLQNSFAKKMEKIISPSFFKMQAIYEPKLYNTDIFQVFNNNECKFIIKKDNNKSEITIKYNNDYKIDVEILETFKRKSHTENVTFTQETINEEKIEAIIQTVAETFRKNLYKVEEESLL